MADIIFMPDVRYKALRNGHIARLIVSETNNEKRTGIKHADRAKYRCAHAKVLDIQHSITGTYCTEGYSIYDPTFKYTVDAIVSPKGPAYDVLGMSGIHYFINYNITYNYLCNESLNQQLYDYHYKNSKFTLPPGGYVLYHDNGYIKLKCYYKDGNPDIKMTGWYDNEKINYCYMYKDGMKNGKFRRWYKNGNVQYKGIYKNGNLDGTYTQFDKDGNIIKSRVYKDGNITESRVYKIAIL